MKSNASDAILAQQVAIASMAISGFLAILKLTVGWLASSTAVFADGLESASDVAASGVVLFGLTMAARPPDNEHPYGHGRLETLSGFTLGWMLVLVGVGITIGSMRLVYVQHEPPHLYAIWAMVFSVAVKSGLAAFKFRTSRRTRSEGLRADAFNDSIDILSGLVALTAVSLAIYDPQRFAIADHIGGLGVGIVVVVLGMTVVRNTTLQLIDTMPEPHMLAEVRKVAVTVPGALGVEKIFARKTGLHYHVDLHLEVDPELTVRDSHEIASAVRARLCERIDWVADVLVHVEPHGM